MAAVRAIGVTKRFESTCALDGVALTVAQGELRGLLGPNGAGKTTLLRVLFGLITPDAGSIELFDTPAGRPEEFRLRGVAGFVEDPTFYPYLSGRANLELLAELDGGGARERVGEVLERVGLAARGDDRVSGYSTGMRQRLGIAASLLRAPRLLLLDEPTSGLDPAGVQQIGSLVQELSAEGVAVLLSSHQIGEIEGICDSFTFLRSGLVVWDGTAEQLAAQAPSSSYRLQTSEDPQALAIANRHPEIRAATAPHGGLTLTAREAELDPYILELGTAGVAVRRLELTVSPLESMFFALTGEGPGDREAVAELPDRVLSAS